MSVEEQRNRDRLKQRIVSVLESAENHTLTLSKFLEEYSKRYEKFPDHKLLESFPDACKVERHPLSEDVVKLTIEAASRLEFLEQRLSDLLGRKPTGYSNDDLWIDVQKMIGAQMLKNYGYQTVDKLLQDFEVFVDSDGIRRVRLRSERRRQRGEAMGGGGGPEAAAPAAGRPPCAGNRNDEVDRIAKDCIEALSKSKVYVSVEAIEKLLVQRLGVSSLSEVGIGKVEDLDSVKKHVRTQGKFNAHIEAFVSVRPIVTLHELGEYLSQFVDRGSDFESLNLGPLQAQPLVYEHFRFPPDADDVPQITTGYVLETLHRYLTVKNLWNCQFHLEEFLDYMTELRGCHTPYELGLRIKSASLAVQVVKQAQHNYEETLASTMDSLTNQTASDLAKAFDNFVQSVIDKNSDYSSVRREYAKMTPDSLAVFIYDKLLILWRQLELIIRSRSAEDHHLALIAQNKSVISDFIECLKKDELSQRVFQFVVCCSSEQIQQACNELLAIITSSAANNSVDKQITGPMLDDLIHQIKRNLERCLTPGTLSLPDLANIENGVSEENGSQYFSDLGHGTFLDLMTTNEEITRFLEDNGSGLFRLSSSNDCASSSYQPSQDDVMYFWQQCAVQTNDQLRAFEKCLCYHYGSRDVTSLGCGSLAKLVEKCRKQRHLDHTSCVSFESALVALSRNPCLADREKAGILGHITEEQAIICLQNCPLLEDLHEWTQWDVVFEPELGSLKDFIQKCGNTQVISLQEGSVKRSVTTSVLALETRPGVLLKVTADTSPDKFLEACSRHDAREVCGHLVSIIVTNGQVARTGLMLLGNHVMTAIQRMQADQIPGASTDGNEAVAEFVLDCLVLLPRLIVLNVAEKVFLGPLAEVIGQAKSLELLLKLARTPAQKTRLQMVGMMLGIQDWSRTFLDKVIPQEEGTPSAGRTMPSDASQEEQDSSEQLQGSDEATEDILSDEEQNFGDNSKRTEGTVQSAHGTEIHDDTSQESKDSASGVPPVGEIDPRKALIDRIRREEFGVDVVLSDDGQKLMLKQQERLGRSLNHLSKELYSRDTHFVLELIQNADDNDYPESMYSNDCSECPSVKFIVDKDAIIVLNNECGFHEENIRAICDIGRTTKSKHKCGYIGQKGIGFKSVFRVTNRPEIHSNGYHFCFDVNSGPTGYILPQWIGSDGDKKQDSDKWTTRIILPLNSSVDGQSHAVRFDDVHPSLLLFLHRLKLLIVENKVEGYILEICRLDISKNIIQIKHSDTTDHWFIIRKVLDAREILLKAKSGVEIASTEIAMAFPILAQEEVHASFQPPKQPVFAFLPLRSHGFRFIVQADFDVPSSRENVDRDSLWNQWLISELPKLFIEGLEAFKEHPEFTELEAVCRFMQFVPLEDEILDLFHPVAAQIMKMLKAMPCLPASSDNNSEGLRWMLPSQLIVARDDRLREVVPSAMLRDTLSLDYLHPEVAEILSPALLTSLGVRRISVRHLIEIRKAVLAMQTQSRADFREQIVSVAKWFACVYQKTMDGEDSQEITDELLKLPTIPLASGTMVALENESVFFPPESPSWHQPDEGDKFYMMLLQDLNVVHPELLQCQDLVSNSHVTQLLKNLHVRHLTPHHLIHHHILPVFQSNQWQKKRPELLLAYVTYIKRQLEKDPSLVNVEKLKKVMVILTNHGPVKATDTCIHFTRDYLNDIDLSNLLPGFNWILLDNCYLQGSTSAADVQKWRNFFTALGVTDFLSLRTVQMQLTRSGLMCSPWADLKDLSPDIERFFITDKQSPEAEYLIRKNSHPETYREQMSELFALLNQFWDKLYKQEDLVTQIRDAEGRLLKEVETSFSLLLKRSAWVPASVPLSEDSTASSGPDARMMVPEAVYIRSAETEMLFDHVPYVLADVSLPSSFAKFLGIRCTVDVRLLSDLLTAWCQRTGDDCEEPTRFRTCLNRMKLIYRFLHENMPPKDFRELMDRLPLIFVPDDTSAPADQPTSGVFLRASETFWHDPSGLFAKYGATFSSLDTKHILGRAPLKSLYADLEHVCQQAMQLDIRPTPEAYVELMLHLPTVIERQNAEDILIALSILGSEMTEGQHGRPEIAKLKQLIRNKNCFLEKYHHRWISLSEKPMMADDVELEKVFKDKEGVYFLECGERFDKELVRSDAVKAFYKMLDVQDLTKCLDIRLITEMYKPFPSLREYVRDVIGHIQKVLAGKYPDVYKSLQSKKIAEKLAAMTFGKVSKLEMRHTLKHLPQEPVTLSKKCHISMNENQFIVHKDYTESYSEINKHLAQYFSEGNEQCYNKIRLLLDDLHKALITHTVESVIKEHNIGPLPVSEQEWTIPEPVLIDQEQSALYSKDSPNQVSSVPEEMTQSSQEVSSGLSCWPPRQGSGQNRQRWNEEMEDEEPSEEKPVNGKHPIRATSDGSTSGSTVDDSSSSSTADTNTQKPAEKRETKHPMKCSPPSGYISRSIYPFDPKMWTGRFDRAVVYEDVDGDLQPVMPDGLSVSERVDRHKVGLWGERFVKAYLEHLAKQPHSGISSIRWMYEEEEYHTPYDLIVTMTNTAGEAASTEDVFIEVKTTESNDKAFFEISVNELMFALDNRDKYHIYRVFNAGRSDAFMKKVANLADKIKKNQVYLFLTI